MKDPRRRRPQKRAAKARWHAPPRPPVVIVGFGRLGGALALGLRARGWPVCVFPRSDASVRRAAELGLTLADHEKLIAAEVCVLAVPDRVIASRAEELAA